MRPAQSYSIYQIVEALGITLAQFGALSEKNRDKLVSMAIKDLDRRARHIKLKNKRAQKTEETWPSKN